MNNLLCLKESLAGKILSSSCSCTFVLFVTLKIQKFEGIYMEWIIITILIIIAIIINNNDNKYIS